MAKMFVGVMGKDYLSLDNDIPYTNYASLCRAKEITELIWKETVNVNNQFARVEQIKKITNDLCLEWIKKLLF